MRLFRGTFSLLLLLFAISDMTFAQDQREDPFRRFQAGIVGGVNFSQIDGDNLAGFNKFGFHAGGVAHAFLDDRQRFSLSLEILFNQKGSRSTFSGNSLTVNYAEVPLQFNYHDKGRLIFSGGLAFANIFSFRENGINLDIEDTRRELSYLMTATFMTNTPLGIGLRYEGSITSFGSSVNPQVSGLINRLITLRAGYYF